MPQYTTSHSATSNGTINTADLFLELVAAAGSAINIKRVRVGYGDGTQTTGQDNMFRVTLYRYTTTTAGTTTTPNGGNRVPKDANKPAATATVKAKSGTTACANGTGTVTIVDMVSLNARALYEYLARDDDDLIATGVANCFSVVIQSSVVSQVFTVTIDHME